MSSSKIVPIEWLSRPGTGHFRPGAAPALAQIDGWIEKLFEQETEDVGLHERGDLVAELELVQQLLNVRREAVEIRLEVGLQLLTTGAGREIAQAELRVL